MYSDTNFVWFCSLKHETLGVGAKLGYHQNRITPSNDQITVCVGSVPLGLKEDKHRHKHGIFWWILRILKKKNQTFVFRTIDGPDWKHVYQHLPKLGTQPVGATIRLHLQPVRKGRLWINNPVAPVVPPSYMLVYYPSIYLVGGFNPSEKY